MAHNFDLELFFLINKTIQYWCLKTPNVDFIKPYFKEGDPKEIYIPLNECAYHLIETKNRMDIFYWVDWMIQYDEQCIKTVFKLTYSWFTGTVLMYRIYRLCVLIKYACFENCDTICLFFRMRFCYEWFTTCFKSVAEKSCEKIWSFRPMQKISGILCYVI